MQLNSLPPISANLSAMENENYGLPTGVIDLLLDAVCVVDAEGRFVYVSAASERIFGYTPDEMIGKAMLDMVLPEDRAKTLEAAEAIMSGRLEPHFENRYLRKDGRVVHIMWSARWSAPDQLRIAVARDITELKQAESLQAALYAISEAAHAAEDFIALLQQVHLIVGKLLPVHTFTVALCDQNTGRLVFPYHVDEQQRSAAPLEPIPGLCAEILRTGQSLLLNPESLSAVSGELRAIEDSPFCWLSVPLHSREDTVGALVLRGRPGRACYTERDKELLQYVSTQVVTAMERKQSYDRLQYMAQYDDLTGLPNRASLYERLKGALARARRNGTRVSLLYLDLDDFKQVNDSLGHTAGDLLLKEVAERLRRCVRDTDTVARMGGDEFVVLLESIKLPEHAALVSENIRNALSEPVVVYGRSLCVPPSIGIAIYPEDGEEEGQLLRHADEAMYVAKAGRNTAP